MISDDQLKMYDGIQKRLRCATVLVDDLELARLMDAIATRCISRLTRYGFKISKPHIDQHEFDSSIRETVCDRIGNALCVLRGYGGHISTPEELDILESYLDAVRG